MKALESGFISSKIVYDCAIAMKELRQQNHVTLMWVPGHSGIHGNEAVDKLANIVANTAFVGAEPFCGISMCIIKKDIQQLIRKMAKEFWINEPRMNHSKNMLAEPDPKIAKKEIVKY